VFSGAGDGSLVHLHTGPNQGGKVSPVIDRIYPLDQAAEAIGYLEQGRARGKVVLTV
jgi:NADPH:quinone reductase-like Zn-dependent oxidoreductase